jgi:hypothetical protein
LNQDQERDRTDPNDQNYFLHLLSPYCASTEAFYRFWVRRIDQ